MRETWWALGMSIIRRSNLRMVSLRKSRQVKIRLSCTLRLSMANKMTLKRLVLLVNQMPLRPPMSKIWSIIIFTADAGNQQIHRKSTAPTMCLTIRTWMIQHYLIAMPTNKTARKESKSIMTPQQRSRMDLAPSISNLSRWLWALKSQAIDTVGPTSKQLQGLMSEQIYRTLSITVS